MYRNQHVCTLKGKNLLKAAIYGLKESISWQKRTFDNDRDIMKWMRFIQENKP